MQDKRKEFVGVTCFRVSLLIDKAFNARNITNYRYQYVGFGY